MGQKSNLITLRKSNKPLTLLKDNPIQFLYGLQFLNLFEKLLNKRGAILVHNTLNFVTNQIFLTLRIFFKTAKVMHFRRKKLSSILDSNKTSLNNSTLSNFFIKQFNFIQSNLTVLNIRVLNKDLDKKAIIFFYHKTKKFLNSLFSRRFNLFIDFIKISSLYSVSKINSKSYLQILGQIFRTLPKRQHSKFLFFLKFFFQTIIYTFPKIVKIKKNLLIKGIKFIINGKLKGKTRASSVCLQIGSVPTQSIKKNIEFSRTHVYTVYGAFGFKIWVYR